MTKAIPFPALTTPFSCIFLWIAPSIAETDAIVANGAKKNLVTGTPLSSMNQLIYLTKLQEISLIELF